MIYTAVVLAAGKGTRMGTEVAKQYLEINNKPVLAHGLEAFQASPFIHEIILMTDESHLDYCREQIVERYGISKVHRIKAGGQERYESVWKALQVIREECGKQAREGYVLIHDGARPFVTGEIIERICTAVEEKRACVAGMPVKDTIKLTDSKGVILESPDRRLVWSAQTPQAFEFCLLYEAFSKQMRQNCSGITDDAMVVERQLGIKVSMVEGSYENIKITTPEDLTIARILAEKQKKL